jgi:hypothetical protein
VGFDAPEIFFLVTFLLQDEVEYGLANGRSSNADSEVLYDSVMMRVWPTNLDKVGMRYPHSIVPPTALRNSFIWW